MDGSILGVQQDCFLHSLTARTIEIDTLLLYGAEQFIQRLRVCELAPSPSRSRHDENVSI